MSGALPLSYKIGFEPITSGLKDKQNSSTRIESLTGFEPVLTVLQTVA
jgi:hypothetical protein